jgi:dTDP-4-dehydrorhamnose reductase
VRRILITGGSSYLGQHLVPLAAQQFAVRYTYFSQDPLDSPEGRHVDLRDGMALMGLLEEWQPEAIIHAAASNRSADMEAVICLGAMRVRDGAESIGARLIHISTDVIFDGRHAPYCESDPPSPIHAYGRAKAVAEDIVARYPNHVIVRTSLIYGLEIMDRSTEWIARSLKDGRAVTLFDNQLRNPVWAVSLSQACLELCDLDFRGILNVAGRQVINRAELGQYLLDWWGISERETMTVDRSDDSWPVDCRLDLAKAFDLLSTPLPGIDEVISAAQAR